MENKYEFLFPFERITKNAKILIYGAGLVGKEYFEQISITGYCKVEGFVDRAFAKLPRMLVPVYSPDDIQNLSYDYIVLAQKSGSHIQTILQTLYDLKVDEKRIVYVGPRSLGVMLFKDNQHEDIGVLAFQKKDGSVAIRLGGGMGDDIIAKKFYEEFLTFFPQALVDVYSTVPKEILTTLYGDVSNLNLIINDTGIAYKENADKYDLALNLSANLRIDVFKEEKIKNINAAFADKVNLYQEQYIPYIGTSHSYITSQIYKGNNCYTAANDGGFFSIKDMKVDIPLKKSWKDEFDKLGIHRYITLNYGNGVSANSDTASAKQWPIAYFHRFVELFSSMYPDIAIVQIGARNAKKIEGIDQYILGESMELIKYVLKNSIFHMDIEGGLVHLATQLGTKCVVLFGLTQIDFLSYKQNINIVSDKCSGCWGLDSRNLFGCIRGLAEPECMYDITPEKVIKKINECIITKILQL